MLFGDLADALPEIRSEWARAHQTRGLIFLKLDDPGAAIRSFERAGEIFDDLLDDHPERTGDRFDHVVTLVYLGSLLVDAGDQAEVARVRARLSEVLNQLPEAQRERIVRLGRYRRIQGENP